MSNQKEFDFVVYGATGFTGKLVIEYLVLKYKENTDFSWAMAGRSLEKLNSVKESKGMLSKPQEKTILAPVLFASSVCS